MDQVRYVIYYEYEKRIACFPSILHFFALHFPCIWLLNIEGKKIYLREICNVYKSNVIGEG